MFLSGDVTANVYVCKGHCGYKPYMIAKNLKVLHLIPERKIADKQKRILWYISGLEATARVRSQSFIKIDWNVIKKTSGNRKKYLNFTNSSILSTPLVLTFSFLNTSPFIFFHNNYKTFSFSFISEEGNGCTEKLTIWMVRFVSHFFVLYIHV